MFWNWMDFLIDLVLTMIWLEAILMDFGLIWIEGGWLAYENYRTLWFSLFGFLDTGS